MKFLLKALNDYESFYDQRRSQTYGDAFAEGPPEQHAGHRELTEFIERNGLQDARCLEIGSSGGAFQDLVPDYYGTDIAENLRRYYHKPYRVCSHGRFPFDDESFDAIWTVNVFEHIPELQDALDEVKRLLRPKAFLFFKPAWQCRPWAAEGYAVRPYSDFGVAGKIKKALVPLRNSIIWRSLWVMPKRVLRHVRYLLGCRWRVMPYERIKPNYETYWTSDSDACNSIDPHDAILWFRSNGFECLSHVGELDVLLVRTGPLVFRKLVDLK